MKRTLVRLNALALTLLLLAGTLARVEGNVNLPLADQPFSNDELDELLAPIALYPDPLLAQVIPAATFIDQLEEAQRVLGGSSDDNLISEKTWDVSVKSVAHYPQILKMMVDKRDWTIAVGQAYVNQSTDVGAAIQRLRAEAKSAGSLVTTPQQEVISEGEVIRIVPAQPQVIYVPQYNPDVVYVGPSTGAVVGASLISFGTGLAIGAWLNNDWDWHRHHIFYHGWNGGGWIARNRTFINVNVHRNVYINNRYTRINVNRDIVRRDISVYRTNLNRNAVARRERTTTVRRTTVNRQGNAGTHTRVERTTRTRSTVKTDGGGTAKTRSTTRTTKTRTTKR
jgi:hypothetical protein